MSGKLFLAVTCSLLLTACSDSATNSTAPDSSNTGTTATAAAVVVPDAATLLRDAASAMGTDTLTTLTISGEGFDFVLGQSAHPDLPWPRFINSNYTRLFDFSVPSTRMTRTRSQGEDPPRGGGQQPYATQNQDQVLVVAPSTNWTQQLQLWMHPHGFLKAAQARQVSAESATVDGVQYAVLTFTGDNGAPVKGYINAANQVAKIETWIANPMFGDMHYEANFSAYQDFGGVQHPARIVELQGGYPVLDLTIGGVQPNAAVEIIAPQATAGGGGGGGGGGAAQGLPTEQLADGIYLILGGYASLAIEFSDHVVVVEGPQSEARAQAVIAEAKRLIPDKPIRYLVNTHHHFDHASGVRTFAAEGATILTHEINVPYFERLFSLPRTIEPDALALSGASAQFEAVGDIYVLQEGDRVVELHRMQDMLHNDGLLMVYLPEIKLLLQADAYNPPGQPPAPLAANATASPYTLNLLDNIERLGLDVDRIIAVHAPADGRAITLAEVESVTGRAR